ncbi:unnamed protein product [Protopolystoma xenopodis]|uniref:Fibronectin type-III domain-containing protein n=1 Tax=Protopolystoma xenopodis TaxID=117903 RepID=A0A3S5CI36_9PLAT|nr:unnamed protein product [Protopolystoma xenopodis]
MVISESADFISQIQATVAPLGGKAVFTCRVDGRPPPKVTWFRNGLEIKPESSGNKVRISPPDPNTGLAKLELSDIGEQDGGTIVCEVANQAGKKQCSAELEVLNAPKFLGGVHDQQANEGDLVKFKVPYSGKGHITLKLKCNGQDVPESANVKLVDLDGVAAVQLKDITRDRSGKYTLIIENESGASVVPFDLKVLSPPGQCQGPLSASETTPFSTRLTWKPPRDDGGAKVSHYTVERCELGKDRWVPVASGCREPTCELQGLQENHQYKFRVAALNESGQGDWIELTEPLTAKYPFGRHTNSSIGHNLFQSFVTKYVLML